MPGLQTDAPEEELQRKIDNMAEVLKKLEERAPERPPYRVPPHQMQVQRVSFSVADHLVPGTATQPSMADMLLARQSTATAPTPKLLLQQAMELLMQQRRN